MPEPPWETRATRGERAADRVASIVGSWRFIIIQSSLIVFWMMLNSYGLWALLHHKSIDPYPFILLNLCLSLQAAFTGPILQMTGNRKDALDAARTAHQLQAMQATMVAIHEIIENMKHQMAEQDIIMEEVHDVLVLEEEEKQE